MKHNDKTIKLHIKKYKFKEWNISPSDLEAELYEYIIRTHGDSQEQSEQVKEE